METATHRGNTTTIGISLPPALLERIDAAAAADDRSRSNWIRIAAEKELTRKALAEARA